MILTIALLIIVVCNLGVLWLYMVMLRDRDHRIRDIVGDTLTTNVDMTPVAQWLEENFSTSSLKKRFDRIDHDNQQIKTRLADEEREDQRAKAKVRRNKQKHKASK